MAPHTVPDWLKAGLFGALYFVTGQALLPPAPAPLPNVLWPPAGIGLAAYLLLGRRALPFIALPAFVLAWEVQHSALHAAVSASANVLQPALGAYLLRRADSFDIGLRRVRDVMLLLLWGAIVSTAAGALVGEIGHTLLGFHQWSEFSSVFLEWWRGDALGVLVAAPLILVWGAKSQPELDHSRMAEGILVLLLLALVSYAGFVGWAPGSSHKPPSVFWVVPFLIWAAIRLGQRGAVLATTTVLTFAVWGAISGRYHALFQSTEESLLYIWGLIVVLSVSVMLHAASVEERTEADVNRRRLATILEATSDFVGISSPEGRAQYINRAGRRMVGLSDSEDISSRTVADFHPAWATEKIRTQGIPAAVRDGAWSGETAFRARDGREIPALQVILAHRGADGNVDFLSTIARDLTELKKAEDAVRRSERKYRDLFENANDVIFTLDLEGNITSLNQAGERISGVRLQEGRKVDIRDVVPPESRDLIDRIMARALAGEIVPAFEVEVVSKEGQRHTLESFGRVILEDGKPVGLQGIARDVTERRQLELQLRQAQKMEAIGLLAGGVAHDFNNLLSVILGYGELLMEDVGPEKGHRQQLQEVVNAASRAASLTGQLLAFSRKQVLQPKVLDLNTVVIDIAKMLRRLIGEHIELTTRLGSSLGHVKVDPGQIEQVVMNLAVNARDAMPKGGRLVIETANAELDETYVRTHPPTRPGHYVMLAVTDSGVGMDRETQRRIFEPFFTTKEPGKGTGLGLATVYGIVKQSGGYIWVYSELGQGTTFRIYLPRVDEVPTLAALHAGRPEAAGSETILLVEDEASLRGLVKTILAKAGYRVLAAASPAEAQQLAGDHGSPVHLLLTDVVMPGSSGQALAQQIRSRFPQTRVLFMSGYADEIVGGPGIGPDLPFIQKPFTAEGLLRKVRETLES